MPRSSPRARARTSVTTLCARSAPSCWIVVLLFCCSITAGKVGLTPPTILAGALAWQAGPLPATSRPADPLRSHSWCQLRAPRPRMWRARGEGAARTGPGSEESLARLGVQQCDYFTTSRALRGVKGRRAAQGRTLCPPYRTAAQPHRTCLPTFCVPRGGDHSQQGRYSRWRGAPRRVSPVEGRPCVSFCLTGGAWRGVEAPLLPDQPEAGTAHARRVARGQGRSASSVSSRASEVRQAAPLSGRRPTGWQRIIPSRPVGVGRGADGGRVAVCGGSTARAATPAAGRT